MVRSRYIGKASQEDRRSDVCSTVEGAGKSPPNIRRSRLLDTLRSAAVNKRSKEDCDRGQAARRVLATRARAVEPVQPTCPPRARPRLLSLVKARCSQSPVLAPNVPTADSLPKSSSPSDLENLPKARAKPKRQPKARAKTRVQKPEVKTTFEQRNQAAIEKRQQRAMASHQDVWRKVDDNHILRLVSSAAGITDELWVVVGSNLGREPHSCEARYWELQEAIASAKPKAKAKAKTVSKVPKKGVTRHWKVQNAMRQTAFEESQPAPLASQASSVAFTPRLLQDILEFKTGLTPTGSAAASRRQSTAPICDSEDEIRQANKDLLSVPEYVTFDEDLRLLRHKEALKGLRRAPKAAAVADADTDRKLDRLVADNETGVRIASLKQSLAEAQLDEDNARTLAERELARSRVVDLEEELAGEGDYSD